MAVSSRSLPSTKPGLSTICRFFFGHVSRNRWLRSGRDLTLLHNSQPLSGPFRILNAILMFHDFEHEQHFRRMWESIRIQRRVAYSLFTFGDSDLPYYLITPQGENEDTVRIRQGQITISRAKIITPDSMQPELRDFFEDNEDFRFVDFLMSRSAAFSNLKLSNQRGTEKIVTDTVEEAVDRLNRQLDSEVEARVAILTAPAGLAGFALLKYATQRVTESAPDNLNELRERGLLP